MRMALASGALAACVVLPGCGYPCTGHNLATSATGEITSIESVVTQQKRLEIAATCQATLAANRAEASKGDGGDAGTDDSDEAGGDASASDEAGGDAGASDEAGIDAGASDGGGDRIVGRWNAWVSFGLPCTWPQGCLLVRTEKPYEMFVRMERPASAGIYSLPSLHGEICERFRNGPAKLCYGWLDQDGEQTDWHCAPMAGQLTVHTIVPPCSVDMDVDSQGVACGRLDADLVLAGSTGLSASQDVSAEGQVHLDYGDAPYETTCGGSSHLYPEL
jgi:hypothetical protein